MLASFFCQTIASKLQAIDYKLFLVLDKREQIDEIGGCEGL